MADLGVKDTAAFRVIRQIVDHTWGSDEKLDDREIVALCKAFRDNGGSWRGVMGGDSSSVQKLEDVIDFYLQNRMVLTAATRVAGLQPTR